MKVSELKKGMLLATEDSSYKFHVFESSASVGNEPWCNVVPKRRKRIGWAWSWEDDTEEDLIAVYVGTKSDVSGKTKWSNRYILIQNKIVPVDPAAWRRIKPAYEGDNEEG